ncbi:HNH endonuclease signature motif containing protein [Aeromicrobium sp. CnD17-E]|uniref:HNH endonuclease signature motif containing protein n=1 Tax=Aeromicrobium sp. CnD17-E TaxID=2954487 RepID=UPI002098224D|nr:HNH endonuclease signature motif containing protein [Aeromicrobium sp. CnD17-E]MCO7239333.1 HNH endonuclease [Aeromicrobium sp. CnD17-E]
MDGNGNADVLEGLTSLGRERARAEAAELVAMLRFRDAELVRTAGIESPMVRLVERSAIALEIGQAVGLSEGQVTSRLAAADRLRERAPQTWLAFRRGDVDWARGREVASTLLLLQRPESHDRLDDTVVAYAKTHTVAELRAWLRRFVARVEAEEAAARAEAARRQRDVQVTHVDDAMAWVNAYLPSHLAAAIGARLNRVPVPDGDDRTRGQRRADAFVDLLLAEDTPSTGRARTDIGVVIDADVLAGAEPGPAVSDDGTWTVPAEWVLEHLDPDDTFFHRLLVDPITRDVLAHEYVGRFAPDVLAAAISFRDGVCQAPGCLRPARDCDLDHREPHPRGPTNGSNLWALHRRHHAMKSHRTLRWILPSGRTVDAEPATHGVPDGNTSHVERAVARGLTDDHD